MVEHYGSDSSLDDHVYKAIVDKKCNFKTNSEQLFEEKASLKKKTSYPECFLVKICVSPRRNVKKGQKYPEIGF